MFESYYRAPPVAGLDSRVSLVHAGLAYTIGDPRLCTEDTVVCNLNVSGNTYLPREDAMLADFRTSGDAYLRAEERGFSYFNIVRYLHEIVDFHVAADDSGAHHSPVDGGVGAYLDIVFDDDVSYLRNLLIDTLCIGFKAKAVRSD